MVNITRGETTKKANKVVLADKVLIDLTEDTIIEDKAFKGYTFHKADGTIGEGKYEPEQIVLQDKSIELTQNHTTTTIRADEGYNGLSSVEVTVQVQGGGSGSGDAELVVDRSITEITPDSFPNITTIGRRACLECNNLVTVVLGDNITTVWDYAFIDCVNLSLVILPDTLEHLGYEAFGNCNQLTEVTLPYLEFQEQNEPYALYNAFNKCPNLSVINFHGTLEQWNSSNIKSGLQDNLQQMITVHCTDGDTQVNGPVGNMIIIYNDDSQVSIPVTKNISAIDYEHFSTDPYSREENENYEIQNIQDIKEILVPEGVQYLRNNAFNLRYYDEQYGYPDNSLIRIKLPSTLTQIGMSAFRSCTHLINIEDDKGNVNTLPSSVYDINEGAFRSCKSLPNLTLPNISYLNRNLFRDCTSLQSITIKRSNDILYASDSTIFTNVSLSHIYVPSRLVNMYKEAEFWSQYASIIEADPTEPILSSVSLFDSQKNYYTLTYDPTEWIGAWRGYNIPLNEMLTFEFTFTDGKVVDGISQNLGFDGDWGEVDPTMYFTYSPATEYIYSSYQTTSTDTVNITLFVNGIYNVHDENFTDPNDCTITVLEKK